jgi:hypothetical protein
MTPAAARAMVGCGAAILAGAFPPSAGAQDGGVHAVIAPKATIAPVPTLLPRATGKYPAFHCDMDYCGFDALKDLWKRDALKPEPAPSMNADSVILERARFEKQVERFGDPHEPVVFQYEIPGLGLCLIGIAMIKTC